MRSRLLRRRAATAAGLYASVALGILVTVVAARILGKERFGIYATALLGASFFQMLLDLTVEDALTKVGFRYVAAKDWGKLRRLFQVATQLKLLGGVVASLVLVALAPLAGVLFDGADGLTTAVLVAALLPLVQCTENVSTTALLLRGRYDIRGGYQTLAQGGKLVAVTTGAYYGGVAWAIAGMVLAQAVATGAVWVAGRIALARFPVVAPTPLGDDVPAIRSFVVQSSVATGLVSARTALAPLVLGLVSNTTAVGLFKIAQTPQAGYSAASSPVRLILLTEQTRDWEHGRPDRVFTGLRRYMLGATLVAAVSVPIFFAAMGWLVHHVFAGKFDDATTAAQIVLIAAGLQLVLGWTKSFPTTIGRPDLRILTHGVETAVLLPLTAILGATWGVEGAAVAVVASTVAFGLTWAELLRRIRQGRIVARAPAEAGLA